MNVACSMPVCTSPVLQAENDGCDGQVKHLMGSVVQHCPSGASLVTITPAAVSEVQCY